MMVNVFNKENTKTGDQKQGRCKTTKDDRETGEKWNVSNYFVRGEKAFINKNVQL